MGKEARGFSLAGAAATAVMFCLSLLLLASAVAAQDDGEEEFLVEEELVPEESAGVTPDSPLYILDKIVDNVQLAMAKGDDKTRKALEIKEERIAEASVMVDKKKPGAAQSALELATKAAEQARRDISPELEKETNENVRRAAKLLSGLEEKLSDTEWEEARKALDAQLSEEERVRVAMLVSKSRLSYCDSLAKQDFDLMKGDELCQIEKAPDWLRGRVEGEFRAREDNARKQIIDSVSTCVIDPKKCDCSQIPVAKHSQDCEVKKALAIRCEYENDNDACAELSSEKAEDLLPEFIGEEGKGTVLEILKKKEQQMFEKFRPPECEAAATFEECFQVMKDLYGTPMQCEGLSDEECMDFIKRNPPGEKPNFPPECNEAGVQEPLKCAELMFSKYGTPPQCEGLDTRECMKLMRQERPDAMQGAMPPECQEAGVKEPRQCFDIMTAKYGTPPECESLSSDDCFKEMMKRGPGEGQGQQGGGQETPECQEKGVKGKDCFLLMTELYGGLPQECEGLGTDECFEKIMKGGPVKGEPPVSCVGLSPEECRAKMQEMNGLPPECAHNPEQCQQAFEGRGVPGGIPAECAGLEPEQCELVMMQKFGPPECRNASKEECEAIMKEKYGEGGFGGAPGPGSPGPGGEGVFGGRGGGFENECEGLAREECDKKMFEKFAPPECSGMAKEECDKAMRERFENRGGQGGIMPQPQGIPAGCEGLSPEECNQRGMPQGIPPECQGLGEEECRQRFSESIRQGERMEERERREAPPGFEERGFEGRQGPGPQRTERQPLPGEGRLQECEGLSPADCGRRIEETMRDRFAQQMPQGFQERQIPQGEQMRQQPPMGQAERIERIGQQEGFPDRQYPQQQSQPFEQRSSEPQMEREQPQSMPPGSEGGGGGEERGGEGSPSPAEAITGQIIKALKWVGGK
ncbi:hypothetical protein HYU17_03115 [Candidatus Woesearchaeota archaeon]|nr:hypothetical protein [Candidatus Woesearchaeota archaeon]